MLLKEKYYELRHENFIDFKNDYSLVSVNEYSFIGMNNNEFPSFIILSSDKNQTRLSQHSKKLGLKCNVKGDFIVDGKKISLTVHIFTCYSYIEKEINVFFDLCETFFLKEESMNSNNILNIYAILASIFTNECTYTEKELQGLYAELFTMYYFSKTIPIHRYWHSLEKMKFDFSIGDNFRIEVKSTTKPERIHHFTHEQLLNNYNQTYIISYLLRRDDSGLTLYDLIIWCCDLLKDFPKSLLILGKVLRNTEKDILCSIVYDQEYIIKHMRVFDVNDIPRFKQNTPEGVIHPEYDSVLENCFAISNTQFIMKVQESISALPIY